MFSSLKIDPDEIVPVRLSNSGSSASSSTSSPSLAEDDESQPNDEKNVSDALTDDLREPDSFVCDDDNGALERFMEQSEYGPLSYVMSFLQVIEMLPIRRVCKFFQDIVRVALELRIIGDSELIDINFRFGRYARNTLRMSLSTHIHRSINVVSEDDETRIEIPSEFGTCFRFLTSTSGLTLLHVSTVLTESTDHSSTRVNTLPLTLLVSESLLDNAEKTAETTPENLTSTSTRTRFSSFVWGTQMCLHRLDSRMGYRGYYYYRRTTAVYYEKEHSVIPVLPGEDPEQVRCESKEEEKEKEEEREEEGEELDQKEECEEEVLLGLRRGKIEYAELEVPPEASIERNTEWKKEKVTLLLETCDQRNIVSLFDDKAWIECLTSGTDPTVFLQLVDRWPSVLHFFHLQIYTNLRSLFSWGSGRSRVVGIIMSLLERRVIVDPAPLFLKSVFGTQNGWAVSKSGPPSPPAPGPTRRVARRKGERRNPPRRRPPRTASGTDQEGDWIGEDSGLAMIIKGLIEQRGYSVRLTEEQRSLQLKGMIAKNFRDAGLFLMEVVGVSWDDQFLSGCTTPLMEAAKHGATHLVDTFVKRRGIESLAMRDASGRNALHYAVHSHNTRTVKQCLTLHTELASMRDENGDTPVEYALHESRFQNAEFLFDQETTLTEAITWDLTRSTGASTSKSVYWQVYTGSKMFKKIQEDCDGQQHELIFPRDYRKATFVEACSQGSIDIAQLVLPGFGDVTGDTTDEEAIVSHTERAQIFVRACQLGSFDVARFIMPTIHLDQEIVADEKFLSGGSPLLSNEEEDDASCCWPPIFFAAFSRNEEIVEEFVTVARKSTLRSVELINHIRKVVPEVVSNLLKGFPTPMKALSLLKVLQPLIGVLDDDALDSVVSMVDDRSLSTEFFVVAASLCPRILPTISEPSTLLKQEVFCDALSRNNANAAIGVVRLLDVTSSIPKQVIGARGGCLFCNSFTPLCLALHAVPAMPDLMTAILSLLDDRPDDEITTHIVNSAKCLFSLQAFVLTRFSRMFGVAFDLLMDHCPNLMTLLLLDEDEAIVQKIRMSATRKECLRTWIECRSDSETILQTCETLFSLPE